MCVACSRSRTPQEERDSTPYGVAEGSRRLPLAGSSNECVRHRRATPQRQCQSGQPHHELRRRAAVEVQRIRASEPALRGRLGESARRPWSPPSRHDDDDASTGGGADRCPFRQLRFEPGTRPPMTRLGMPWTMSSFVRRSRMPAPSTIRASSPVTTSAPQLFSFPDWPMTLALAGPRGPSRGLLCRRSWH